MSSSEPVRLQKYLADSGLCSRRAAEALIAQGEVWVNGAVATLGQKVTPGVDKVTASGKSVRSTAQPRLTLAMHKPRGLACTNDDPHNPDTVFTVLPREFAKFRFFCAGRLGGGARRLAVGVRIRSLILVLDLPIGGALAGIRGHISSFQRRGGPRNL